MALLVCHRRLAWNSGVSLGGPGRRALRGVGSNEGGGLWSLRDKYSEINVAAEGGPREPPVYSAAAALLLIFSASGCTFSSPSVQ